MNLTYIEILTMFMCQGLLVILAVVVGGYLVFRTKRDSFDPFLTIKEPKGSAFNVKDEGSAIIDPPPVEVPDIVKRMSERIDAQMSERIKNGKETGS